MLYLLRLTDSSDTFTLCLIELLLNTLCTLRQNERGISGEKTISIAHVFNEMAKIPAPDASVYIDAVG